MCELDAPSETTSPQRPPASLEWTTEQLLGDAVEVRIRHGDQIYRLRRTRNGKLILVK